MLNDKVKARIKADAEVLYPYASANFETILGRNGIQQKKSFAYIAGAEKEAERAQDLVTALEFAQRELTAMYNEFGMFAYGPIIMNKISEALTKYNNTDK